MVKVSARLAWVGVWLAEKLDSHMINSYYFCYYCYYLYYYLYYSYNCYQMNRVFLLRHIRAHKHCFLSLLKPLKIISFTKD